MALILLCISNSASAANITIYDENGAFHGGVGEDLNILISSGLNDDYNYVIRYRPAIGAVTRVDVNTVDTNYHTRADDVGTDTNVITVTLGSADVNVFTVPVDVNALDLNFTIPSTMKANSLYTMEIWSLENTGTQTAGTLFTIHDYESLVADINFLVTPAIILKHKFAVGITTVEIEPGITPIVAIDDNVVVQGFGFNPVDANTTLKFYDINGFQIDVNMMDVNYADNNFIPGITTDYNIAEQTFAVAGLKLTKDAHFVLDKNAIGVAPDGNGCFDVNIIIPHTRSFANEGTAPRDINITANNSTNGDINTGIIVIPNLTISSDENVTLLICDRNKTCWDHNTSTTKERVSIETAMENNYVDDMGRVAGMWIEVGSPMFVRIEMNTDMNLARGSKRDYATYMDAGEGKAKIDTEQMPEFGVDANITLFKVKSWGGQMPTLANDGWKCPSDMCKNRDGTTLAAGYIDSNTSVATWVYDPSAQDGNIFFRVSGFSEFTALRVDANVTLPGTGSSRRYKQTDGNMLVKFTYADTNYLDTNTTTPLQVKVYLAEGPGDGNKLMMTDTNLQWSENGTTEGPYTTHEIICADTDYNVVTVQSCDLNVDINGLLGTYYIDVNILQSDGNFLIVSSPEVSINAPDVNVTDVNFNSSDYNFTYNDLNLRVDFNISLPVEHNPADSNTVGDVNIIIYLSTTKGAKDTMLTWDKNALDSVSDYNFIIVCETYSDKNYQYDSNCYVDLNLAAIAEGNYYIDIDTNFLKLTDSNSCGDGLGDVNSSPVDVPINDTTAPTGMSITSPATAVTSTNLSSIGFSFSATDATAGVEKYWTSEDGSNWSDNSSSTSYTMSYSGTLPYTKTFYVKSQDWADLNSAQATKTITFQAGTSGETCGNGVCAGGETCSSCPTDCGVCDTGDGGNGGGGGNGGAPPGDTGTTEEVITTSSQSYEPTAEEITDLLTDAGMTEEEVADALVNAAALSVTKEFSVIKITDNETNEVSYRSTFTVTVTNNSGDTLVDIEVVETISKEIAASASEITSVYAFEVLVEDPVIKFIVDELGPGEEASIDYEVAAEVEEEDFTAMGAAIAFGEIYIDPCLGVVCDDANPCTTDTCIEGDCAYTNVADGTMCGTDMVCDSGVCTELVAPPECLTDADCEAGYQCVNEECVEKAVAEDYTMYIIAIVIIIIIIAAYFLMRKK